MRILPRALRTLQRWLQLAGRVWVASVPADQPPEILRGDTSTWMTPELRQHLRDQEPPPPHDELSLARDYAAMNLVRDGLMLYIPKVLVGVFWPETVVLAGCFAGSGEFHIVVGVSDEGLFRWTSGAVPIHEALPELSAADRLFIESGARSPNLSLAQGVS